MGAAASSSKRASGHQSGIDEVDAAASTVEEPAADEYDDEFRSCDMSLAIRSLGVSFAEYADATDDFAAAEHAPRDRAQFMDRIGASNDEHRRALAALMDELLVDRPKASKNPSMQVELVFDENSCTTSFAVRPLTMENVRLCDRHPVTSDEFGSIQEDGADADVPHQNVSPPAERVPRAPGIMPHLQKKATAEKDGMVARLQQGYEIRLPLTGQLLFTVTAYIASGAMGEVYVVTSAGSPVKRAMKRVSEINHAWKKLSIKLTVLIVCYRSSHTRTAKERRKIELDHCQEARLSLEMDTHPNIVAVHYCVVAESEFLMFQDLVDGAQTLSNLIKAKSIYDGPLREVRMSLLAVLENIAEALRHIHSLGIMHQDVSDILGIMPCS
jgi:hypothetical protein